jgi:molybdopterin converting factor small subunit
VRVTVQLFARLREIAGRQQWLCEVPPGASVADLWRELAATYPAMAELFLPPVSGGAARLR